MKILDILVGEAKAYPQWWQRLSWIEKLCPVGGVALWWGIFFVFGGLNADNLTVGCLVLLLAYSGAYPRKLLVFFLPFLFTAIVYESQAFYSDFLRMAIRVKEPYLFDLHFFGISHEGKVLTPNEWWQLHTHSFLDFYTGIFYIIFIPLFIFIAGLFEFYYSKYGTSKHSASYIQQHARLIMWSFFWVNMLGYSTYFWYPAAPPWYVALYGLGPALLDTPANVAGCIRFDELVGLPVFSHWYSRSKDVFGAIPSLHVAYPMLSVYFAFRFGALRLFSLIFYLSTSFAAIYLNHHYVLDVLWGSAYALIVAMVMDKYRQSRLGLGHECG